MTCTAPLTENRQVSTKGYILRTFQITKGWEGREDNAKEAEGEGARGGGRERQCQYITLVTYRTASDLQNKIISSHIPETKRRVFHTTNKTTCFGFRNNCLINKCCLESWKNMYMATVF